MLNYLFTSSSVMFHGEAPCFVSLTDLNVPISDFQIWMVSKPILSCFPCFGHCKIKFITPLLTGSNHAIPWTSPRGFHSHGGTPLSLDAYGCFFLQKHEKTIYKWMITGSDLFFLIITGYGWLWMIITHRIHVCYIW